MKKQIAFLFCLNFIGITLFAQDNDSLFVENKYCVPHYPGGFEEYEKYILENVKLSDTLIKLGAKGGFVAYSLIDKTGKLRYVWRSHNMHDEFDNTVITILEKMPDWSISNDSCEARHLLYISPIRFIVGKKGRTIPLRDKIKKGFEPIPSLEVMRAITNIPLADFETEITPTIEIKIAKD